MRNRNSAFVRRLHALIVALLVALLNAAAWTWLHRAPDAPEVTPRVAGLAYNAFGRWDSPLDRRYPSDAELASDLSRLSALTGRLRTYSASEFPALFPLSEGLGLKLTAGVWLEGRPDHDRRELDAIAQALVRHRHIERIVVGNEVLVRGAVPLAELTAVLDQLRRTSPVPVSTAEPWHIWLKEPELARHVDFITVHLLPYWEGVPVDAAVDVALQRLAQLRERFPDKPVVVGEIGWPSAGPTIGGARAGPTEQAVFTRRLLQRVQDSDLDYFVMEAIDQPWKRAIEGSVGAHWGWLDAYRRPKFALQGPVAADPHWQALATLSSLGGYALALGFMLALPRMRLAACIAFAAAAQLLVALAVALVAVPLAHYLRPLDALLLLALAPALAVTAATLLAQLFEFAELFWDGSLRRRFGARPLAPGAHEPFVSIHLACCNEPADMVIATLDSLRALDWRALEIIVVSNNTRDASLWRPIEQHVQRLRAGHIRFVHLDEWPGYKAGALNYALARSDPRTEIVAVVDADYVVRRDWLRALVGHFDEPSVGIVQAPQAHRGWAARRFDRMMNWEYEGFFRIGMHHRNERDAIIQHGTMTMIRAAALREQGWAEWCLCEDSELGLRLMRDGLCTVYVDRVYGEGLLPDDFGAYKRQRRRWAQGAMQILKAHWRSLAGLGAMRFGQRYHFVAGWLPWIGDAMHLVFSLAAMVWTIGMIAAPAIFDAPSLLFLAPLVVQFVTRLVIGPLLYWRRVPCSGAEIAGAALAGMALSHAVASGVIAGLLKRGGRFEVTRKRGIQVDGAAPHTSNRRGWRAGLARLRGRAMAAPPGKDSAVREETALLLGLLTCVGGVALAPAHAGGTMWALVLLLHGLPYLAALVCDRLSQRPAPTGPPRLPLAAA